MRYMNRARGGCRIFFWGGGERQNENSQVNWRCTKVRRRQVSMRGVKGPALEPFAGSRGGALVEARWRTFGSPPPNITNKERRKSASVTLLGTFYIISPFMNFTVNGLVQVTRWAPGRMLRRLWSLRKQKSKPLPEPLRKIVYTFAKLASLIPFEGLYGHNWHLNPSKLQKVLLFYTNWFYSTM